MGKSYSKLDDLQKLDPNQWESVENHRDYDIVRNKENGSLAEMRNLAIDPKRQTQYQMSIYDFRRTSTLPIVKVLAAKPLAQKSTGLCNVERNIKVLSERILKKFNQFPQLTLAESLYCLREALEGYRVLFQKVGPFQLTEKMMGINSDGQFKVWLNENLGINHPDFERKILQTTHSDEIEFVSSQRDMVGSLVNIIESKNEQGRFPSDLKTRLQDNYRSFVRCSEQLDAWIGQKRVNIVKKIHPNLNYILTANKNVIKERNQVKGDNFQNNYDKYFRLQNVTSQNKINYHIPTFNQSSNAYPTTNWQYPPEKTQPVSNHNQVNTYKYLPSNSHFQQPVTDINNAFEQKQVPSRPWENNYQTNDYQAALINTNSNLFEGQNISVTTSKYISSQNTQKDLIGVPKIKSESAYKSYFDSYANPNLNSNPIDTNKWSTNNYASSEYKLGEQTY